MKVAELIKILRKGNINLEVSLTVDNGDIDFETSEIQVDPDHPSHLLASLSVNDDAIALLDWVERMHKVLDEFGVAKAPTDNGVLEAPLRRLLKHIDVRLGVDVVYAVKLDRSFLKRFAGPLSDYKGPKDFRWTKLTHSALVTPDPDSLIQLVEITGGRVVAMKWQLVTVPKTKTQKHADIVGL